MRLYFKKVSQSTETNNNRKKSVFKIIKGQNGIFEQMQGISLNGEKYNVQQNIIKKNKDSGLLSTQHRVFTIKSSNLKEL